MPSKQADERSVVPVTAIYGANASGKSSLLDGLQFMQQAVLESFTSWDADGGVPRRPFRLNPSAPSEPSLFSVELVAKGVRYAYGFSVDDDKVLEEWLYSYPEKRRRILFERNQHEVKFGTTVARDLKSRLEVTEEITRPNSLFLSACAQVRITDWLPVYRWFRYQLQMRLSDSPRSSRQLVDQVSRLQSRDPDMKAKLLALLRAADIGITGLTARTTPNPAASEQVDLCDSKIIQIKAILDTDLTDDESKRWEERLSNYVRLRDLNIRLGTERRELRFLHGPGNSEFRLEEESAGTRSWLSLLPMALEALAEGYVVAVDELDTSLHPLLTAELVKLFSNPETNPSNAQLIFTSHDSSLLGTMMGEEILSRDFVWFVEKQNNGSSNLFPLTDFKPREGQNIERRYLGGSYGAVPVLSSEEFSKAALHR